MKIKKFRAATMQHALEQIKNEFGDDAIILNTKQVKDEDAPKGERKQVEVTAAIDKRETGESLVKPSFGSAYGEATRRTEATSMANVQFTHLQKEVDYISERLELLLNHVKYENLPHIPKLLQQRARTLIGTGVPASLANQMIEEILLGLKGEDFLQAELVDDKLVAKIKNRFQITGPVRFNHGQPTVVALVGPTGGGKTTSVAKLAAMYAYQYGKKVALVSTDSYRIAAMEQLKAFADIAKLPFAAAYDPSELAKLMKGYAKHDLILVDTVGINPRDMKKMVSLKETLRVSRADEIHLVVSLTTRGIDIRETLKNFSILGYTSLLYTKLDEAAAFGDMLDIAVGFNKAISYIAFGQAIPEDIALADRTELATTILRGRYGIS
ncbi:MAG: flagellar biosynthesis protein FlhF [Candidatus Cloacimonetes bacterium]|nr:flagellar biosynthesis protein FlhF [Candidatus Cloacimonadota bacterium]